MTYLVFAAGLLGLFLGGEFLIRGAVGLARRLRVPQLVIGLTIVGFGTSTPELLVSVQAALAGAPALAIGNVIGSNIANILLILGLSAMIVAVPIRFDELRRDFAAMLAATVALWLMLLGGVLSRSEGIVLAAGLLAYLWISLRDLREAPLLDLRPGVPPADAGPAGGEGNAAIEPDIDPACTAAAPPLWQTLPAVLIGLVILMVGARLLVTSAADIARTFGISEAVIGLTIVAVGTSLPELATSLLAALRRHPEIAVGNVLGSSIFNILCILGLTAVIEPIPVDPRFARLDIVLALAAGLAMTTFAALPGRVNRFGGAALLTVYAGYLAFVGRV